MNLFSIILNYNSAKDTIALYQQLVSFEITDSFIQVIDNASDIDDIKQLKKIIPVKNLILNKNNLGYAGGNNIGIKKAIENNASYILILNPDIRLNENTISILLESINQKSSIAAIGPRICYRNEKNKIYSDGGIIIPEKGYLSSHINYNNLVNTTPLINPINEVNYVNGSCMLIDTSIAIKIGLLNEIFFLYFEEAEWCLRAKKNNYSIVVNTKALAYHSSSTKSRTYHYYMTRNRLLLAKLEKKYYKLTRKKIFSNLIKELFDKLTLKRKPNPYWFSRLKGFLSGVYYPFNK